MGGLEFPLQAMRKKTFDNRVNCRYHQARPLSDYIYQTLFSKSNRNPRAKHWGSCPTVVAPSSESKSIITVPLRPVKERNEVHEVVSMHTDSIVVALVRSEVTAKR